MAKDALFKALERQELAAIEQLHVEAQERYVSLRKDYATRLRLVREQRRHRLEQSLRGLRHERTTRCERTLNQMCTEHRWSLAERFRELAEGLLPQLWKRHHEEILPILAGELPPLPWSTIRVCPDDHSRARELFPGAQIESDPQLDGGFIAICRERSLTVDGSLTTCMERFWPTLLPNLLKELGNDCCE